MISRLRGKPVARRRRTGSCSTSTASAISSPRRRARCAAAEGGERGRRRDVPRTCARTRSQLYGFADAAERELFEHLLSVSGVGPKVALAIVSGSTVGGAAARDRARGHGALRGDPRDRQEDGAAGRARAEGEARRRGRRCRSRARRGHGGHLAARDALVELGYSVLEAERALAGGRSRSCRPRSACASR